MPRDADTVDRIDMNADVVNGAGVKVGKVYHVYSFADNGSLVAHNMKIVLDEQARGQGFSTVFTAATEDYFRRSGAEWVELMATDEDGGLVWARAGFTWNRDPDLLADSVDNITERIARIRAQTSVVADQRLLDSLLERFAGPSVHYPEPAEIAMLRGTSDPKIGEKPTRGSTLGEKIMRGSSWWGMKKL